MKLMLIVSNINVFYGDLQALWDISMHVDKGEIVVLLGSNGSGKSTTLRALHGLMQPSSGKIEFMGERIDRLPPFKIVEKGLSHVPEGKRLFPFFTVLENLKIGAYTKEAREKLGDTLEWVFQLFPILKERKDQQASTLSGGEQQMLAIGRALMSRPKLLTLDEPSFGLAPKAVSKMFQVIEELNNQSVSILLVEQNIHFALKIAHRGYVIENGRITLSGSGKELLENDYIKKAYLGL